MDLAVGNGLHSRLDHPLQAQQHATLTTPRCESREEPQKRQHAGASTPPRHRGCQRLSDSARKRHDSCLQSRELRIYQVSEETMNRATAFRISRIRHPSLAHWISCAQVSHVTYGARAGKSGRYKWHTKAYWQKEVCR